MAAPIKNPMFRLNRVVRTFMDQTLSQLQVNAMTQRMFPTEVYSGYRLINEERKKKGQWYSTGEGAKSFRANLVQADDAGHVTMVFSFNEYLRYVDMGVGQGTKYEEVEGGKKANFKRRYISLWDRKTGSSQRPAIMMELRHLESRVRDYLVDFYGYEGQTRLVAALGELPELKIEF